MAAPLRTLNLGILAHVDAGKTTLTERLLYDAGVIDRVGSVDAGTTQTDTMALERERGITIRAAVASFETDGVLVNLVDTPGHSDFIAEVERSLAVLDAAVLVVSAVEGVQAQTVVLMRALQRLRLPTVLFVNKTDRGGADPDRVTAEIATRLTPDVVALPTDPVTLDEVVALRDDAAFTAWEAHGGLDDADREAALTRLVRGSTLYPILRGSALTGVGVAGLRAVLTRRLGRRAARRAGPLQAQVFKIERTAAHERRAYLRLRAGELRPRDRIRIDGRGPARVTGVEVFTAAGRTDGPAHAGQIAVVRGLTRVQVGDTVGLRSRADAVRFARPALEAVVDAVDPRQRTALFAALGELAEQDPLISLRRTGDDGAGGAGGADGDSQIVVSLYGEVQKQVIAAVLEREYGVRAVFEPSSLAHVERIVGTGAHAEFLQFPPDPYLATVGLRVEPAAVDTGVTIGLEVERGALPSAFLAAIEGAIHRGLRQGPHGWPIPDARVLITHTGYAPRQSAMHATFDKNISSIGTDFRALTTLVLMQALLRAGTQVCEPIEQFVLETPADTLGTVVAALARIGAVPTATGEGDGPARVAGTIASRHLPTVRAELPGLTRGEGVLTSTLVRFDPVRGAPPERRRTGPDPRDRTAYIRLVRR